MWSGSETGSHVRLTYLYHSTLGPRVIEKKKKDGGRSHLLLLESLDEKDEERVEVDQLSRFAQVNPPTNPSTYPLLSLK